MYRIAEITEALAQHIDPAAVGVLEEVGTNDTDDIVRKLTVQALVKRNSHSSLKVVITNKGKGIHDLNQMVAAAAIDAIKKLPDRSEAMRILEDTMTMHSDEEVRSKAGLVRELILLDK